MNDVYTDGLIVNQKIKAYMEAHPGVTYRGAYYALIKLEEAEDQELREEFSKRVPVYQQEFKKSYADAAKMVVAHDDSMANAYADDSDSMVLARRIGEIWRAAKQATAMADISMADAVMQILRGEPAAAQKIGGDWLDRQARIEINNLNLGSSIDQAYPIALRIVRNTFPEVADMADFGAVSETAMRIVFIGWFRD